MARVALLGLAASAVMAAACSNPMAPLPDGAVAMDPPAIYRVWWHQVESCSGRLAPFGAVTWYAVPSGWDGFMYRGRRVAGLWTAAGNRVMIASPFVEQPKLVRHEMLHAIIQTGRHPAHYFRERCENWVGQTY